MVPERINTFHIHVVVFVPGNNGVHPSGTAVNFMMAGDKGVIEVAGEAEVVDSEPLVPKDCLDEGDSAPPRQAITSSAGVSITSANGATQILKVHKVYVFTPFTSI